jgi:hypothetical protein
MNGLQLELGKKAITARHSWQARTRSRGRGAMRVFIFDFHHVLYPDPPFVRAQHPPHILNIAEHLWAMPLCMNGAIRSCTSESLPGHNYEIFNIV